jgi:hypothetical protein
MLLTAAVRLLILLVVTVLTRMELTFTADPMIEPTLNVLIEVMRVKA